MKDKKFNEVHLQTATITTTPPDNINIISA